MTVAEIVEWHLVRYPLLGAADIYKLLYQGTFGPGHAVTSLDATKKRLFSELVGLEPDDSDEPEEPIDPGGVLVRVNLRPLVGNHQSAEALASAFVESAVAVRPDPVALAERLAEAVARLKLSLPGLAAELEELAVGAKARGYPAFHHSRLYRLNYRPAYRVILARLRPEVRG